MTDSNQMDVIVGLLLNAAIQIKFRRMDGWMGDLVWWPIGGNSEWFLALIWVRCQTQIIIKSPSDGRSHLQFPLRFVVGMSYGIGFAIENNIALLQNHN